jgi:hypothetical protein
MKDQQLVDELLALTRGQPADYRKRHAFSVNSARLWVRARFSCEYCEHRLLDTVLEYQSFNYDHVLPRTRYQSHPVLGLPTSALFDPGHTFSDEDLLFFALSCCLCNRIKGSFDANAHAPLYLGHGPLFEDQRTRLILRARDYILPIRGEHEQMRTRIQDLVRNSGRVPEP